MENIRTSYAIPTCSDDYSVKKYLQEKFMSQLINEEGFKIPHLGIVKDRLKDKKVLVVLDDVNHLVQLEAMARDTCWFGPGSRIIITTQDQKILQAGGVNHTYKVDFPSRSEAFQMFCMYAFGQMYPKDGFTELAREVTCLVDELPLGLRLMGSYFRGMSNQEDWKKALPRLKTRLDGEIESILKFIYDALHDEDKILFLHIACFFNYEALDIVEGCLANNPLVSDVTNGLHVLAEKSLISLDDGSVRMPDLLVRLGRGIVRKQSVSEHGKRRQFLVDTRDIYEVLSDDKVDSSNVIGIDTWIPDDNKEDIAFRSEGAFGRFYNLQILKIRGRGSLNFISQKLRYLSWNEFPLSCFPSNFQPKFLVKLRMRESKLEKLWEGIQPLNNLCELNLGLCQSLMEFPSIENAIHLRRLNLFFCYSVVEIPSSIGNAIHLQELYFILCLSLVELPSSIGNLINLKELNLWHCSSLVKLPSSMINLCRLSKLILDGCSKLEVCLTNINLESLEELDLSDCSSLEIEDLKPSGTVTKELQLEPSSYDTQELAPWIGRKSRLRRLKLNNMQKLVSLPQLPYSIEELYAENCESLERLDCSFCNPKICLNFANCFKLNQEARDLIIQTRTNGYAVLPGEEVPACFTYRASGSSLIVKLDQNPLCTSSKFRTCIILAGGGEYDLYGRSRDVEVYCSITSKENALSACISNSKPLYSVLRKHLYTFEVEARGVISTELVFEFTVYSSNETNETWEIKECGIFQLETEAYGRMTVQGPRRARKLKRACL